jgi:DNA polymerase elongation subunit (family B)
VSDSKPRIMYLDIETSQNLFWGWELGKQHIGYDQIFKEKEIICICYQWEGSSKVNSLTWDSKKYNLFIRDDDADKEMLKKFEAEYTQADLVVGHNVKFFDVSTIQARIIKHKLAPLSPTLIDDTYLQSKSINFTSHKLDYMADYLGEGHKKGNEEGRKLWIKVQMGDKKALDKMVYYCKNDVILLRKIYHRLQPYIKSNLNRSVYDGRPTVCPNPLCGAENSLESRGVSRTISGAYPRYQCRKCGKWHTDRKNLIKDSGKYPR